MSLVTAIISTHKREPQMLERAVKSVLTQTHKELELIVVDDSPADFALRGAVKDMMAQYPAVTYIQHETCKGACAARNTGLEVAKGEFVAYLDDDDEWLPEKIERQLTGFTSESIALVYSAYECVNMQNDTVQIMKPKVCEGKIFEELIKNNFIGSTSFPLMRTAALRDIGGFDELLPSSQDFDVWLRLSLKYDVAYVDAVLVRYYIHLGDCITKNFSKAIEGTERVSNKYADYIATHPDAFWARNIRIAPFYAGNKQLGKALSLWIKCVVKCPGEVKANLRCVRRMVHYRWGRKR